MKKSTIALIVAAVVCLGLSAFSAKASVTRTNEAIEEIGEVTYSEDCKTKIDRAAGLRSRQDLLALHHRNP